jgi:DNA-binding LacI/PurR family transcriptional regulator
LPKGFRSHLLDGIILCPWKLGAADLRKREDTTPLVLLGERVLRSVDSVAIDNRAVGKAATEHLISIGRRRIGMVRLREHIAGAVEDRPGRVKADFTLLARETTMGAKPFRRRALT